MSDRWDVVIVGAGPAGSTLAALLGRRGVRTLLLDRARFPRDKVCGEYMSPEALATLDRSGALPAVESLPHRKLRGILVHAYDGACSRGTYHRVGPHAPFRPYGLAVRRLALDAALFRHAAASGTVATREEFRVEGLLREGGRVTGVTGEGPDGPRAFGARLVVGADGVRSVVARHLGLSEPARDLEKIALAAYWKGMAHEDYGELHMGVPGYFALAPVEEDLVNINFVADRREVAAARAGAETFYLRHLEANPRLRGRLRGATRVGPVRATGPMARRCKGVTAPGALLIGDAAEFVDPFTGEGLFIALRSAELAADAILAAHAGGSLATAGFASFEGIRRREFDAKYRICWRVQRWLRHPSVANYVVRRLAARPALADRLAAVTGDYAPPELVDSLMFMVRLLAPWPARAASG